MQQPIKENLLVGFSVCGVMMDIMRHFEKLQKGSQISFITLLEIFARATPLMEDGAYPGEYEEQFLGINEDTRRDSKAA